jgi:hypothetical protein
VGEVPNRILKESICTSDNLNELTAPEEILFYRLIVNCDDYGIADARIKMLRAKCFPLKTDTIKESDVEKWLKGLIRANLCFLYEVEGKRYLKMTSWERHQQIRAKRSKFPTPDSNGYQMISDTDICPRNPIQSESNPNPNRSIEILFDHWNQLKIVVHKEITPDIEKALDKAIKHDAEEDIKKSMNHYEMMLNDKKYDLCSYKWSLVNFLSREKGYPLFKDDGEKWINYQEWENKAANKKQVNGDIDPGITFIR